MNRRILVVALVGLALLLPRAVGGPHPVQAARPSTSPHTFLRGLIWPLAHRRAGSARLKPLSLSHQSASGTVSTSEQLRLPASAFPGDFSDEDDHSETASSADNSLFSGLHMSTYTALGMEGGWLQYYAKLLLDGTFDDSYLGTYYSTPEQARTAFQDVQRNPSFRNGIACAAGEQCYQVNIGIEFSDGIYHGTVRIVQQTNALAEIITVVPAGDEVALSSQITSNLNQATNAFLTATQPQAPTATATATAMATRVPATSTPSTVPTSAPTSTPLPTLVPTTIPVDFDIISARTEKAGSSPDNTLQRPAVKHVRVGTSVYLSVYVVVHSAPAGAAASYDVRVKSRGRSVLHKTLQETLGSAGGTPNRKFVKFKPGTPGTYKVTWSVDVNGVTKQGGNSLLVQK